jgi:cytochrome c oxidase subunit II
MIDSFATVTPQGASIVSLFVLALIPSALILAIVVGVIAVVLVRDRDRPGAPEPAQIEGHRTLEIAWTAIPLLLLAVFFGLMLRTMQTVNAEPGPALRVQVIGHQWWWEFRYPDLGIVTANELHVPVGQPVRFELMSGDVIHSFWVPRIGWKKDAIPGTTTVMSVEVDQPGIYDGACTEYCGTQHAWMRIRVVAQPADQFAAWTSAQQAPATASQDPVAARGQQLFLANTCVSCHTVAGTSAAGTVGPNLTHIGSRATLGGGVAELAPANLQQWIRDPHALKPGVLMPAYGSFAPDDLAALAAYLDSLK